MAINTVLMLPELLEIILLDLPTRDLLFAQKVCRTWKEVINTTKSIQKALYFVPGTLSDVHVDVDAAHQHLITSTPATAINPLLVATNASGGSQLYLRQEVMNAAPEASCRSMYLMQPPREKLACMAITYFGVCYGEQVLMHPTHRAVTVRREDKLAEALKKVRTDMAKTHFTGWDGRVLLM
ncbi:hypothetical protein LTR56_013843 [Elasticomyces elasticus]|nr:hypothetical protein LTR56_013843 [Elasticomyces elasticus]KAK3660552.1 hypothetical protein LTR22_007993 [Elasticomyces elasticus]KAK4923834.1 hypothetical protein LTR49_008982 [Elasticomyces elasticus]KAK5751983.1 hypothetical protein LTS12_017916 [Elasticomyces elasticus]